MHWTDFYQPPKLAVQFIGVHSTVVDNENNIEDEFSGDEANLRG